MDLVSSILETCVTVALTIEVITLGVLIHRALR